MPSGKEKRKAIWRKKELEGNLADGSHRENENLSGPDEKSDEGDLGFPVSQVSQQTINEESGESAKSDTLAIGTTTDRNESVEVPELKEEDSSCGNGDVEMLEGPVSNDDSCVVTESLKEILPESHVNEKKLEDEESNEVLGVETTQVESATQITDPLPQEINEVMDSTKSIAQNSEDLSLVGPLVSVSIGTQLKSTIDSNNVILENEGKPENVVSPVSEVDSGSTKFGTKVYPVSTDSSVPPPDTRNHETLLLQSFGEAKDAVKHTEDTHITEFSEKQPWVAPVPRMTGRTSWMNCCGILDLFSGSSK